MTAFHVLLISIVAIISSVSLLRSSDRLIVLIPAVLSLFAACFIFGAAIIYLLTSTSSAAEQPSIMDEEPQAQLIITPLNGAWRAEYGADWRRWGGACILVEVSRGPNTLFILYSDLDRDTVDATTTQADFDLVLYAVQRMPAGLCQ